MSASRANAAAKNRRAGGADISPQQQSRPGQQQQQQAQPKLSVSDAIGLITLRLGRVENIVHQLQTEAPAESVKQEADPAITSRFIDITAFNSLVKRLDVIEQKQKVPVPSPVPVPIPVVTPLPAPTTPNASLEAVQSLEKELKEVKDLLLKLQTFTMDVNGKLVGMLTEEPKGVGGDMDMDMAKMFGGQFDLQSMLRAMQQSGQSQENDSDADQSENVIELSGPNISDLLTEENPQPVELDNVEELN
jgi:hypothetical protein